MSPEVASQGLEQELPKKPDVAVSEIDPLALILQLRRNPDINDMEDPEETNALVDRTVIYLQGELEQQKSAGQPPTLQFAEALHWLRDAVYPINMNFAKRYMTNSRFDLDDFFQVLNTSLVQKHIPNFDATQSHFLYFYKKYGWTTLQEQVYLSASQLSTTAHFGQIVSDEKDAAMQSFSYEGVSERFPGIAPEELAREDDEDKIIRPIMARDILERTAVVIEDVLSETEQTALRLQLDGLSYEDISLLMGMPEKAVDNALQRGRKKLSHIRSGVADGFFSSQEEQAA